MLRMGLSNQTGRCTLEGVRRKPDTFFVGVVRKMFSGFSVAVICNFSMSQSFPHTAMVLAAGYGKRMLPLTATQPKPLLAVGGRAMLDQVLDRLEAAGIRRAVVNAAYLAEQIEAHCAARYQARPQAMDIVVSTESTPLETGGGVKQALPLLGDDPIFIINADLPWQESGVPALARLRCAWDAGRMDMLLLTMPLARARGFGGVGDYALLPDGRLQRHSGMALEQVFIGVQIAKPALYRVVPEAYFSNLSLFDQAEAAGRLFGCVHQGSCYHVGTPVDLAAANALLVAGQGWAVP
jgi:N-acetyl-alpha-D-muramate 1-phosphate uridylyltransferase